MYSQYASTSAERRAEDSGHCSKGGYAPRSMKCVAQSIDYLLEVMATSPTQGHQDRDRPGPDQDKMRVENSRLLSTASKSGSGEIGAHNKHMAKINSIKLFQLALRNMEN